MKTLKIENEVLEMVIAEMSKSDLFSSLPQKSLLQIAGLVMLDQYEPDEIIVRIHEPSDGCFMIIKGEVAILHHLQPDDEIVEIARRKPYDTIGEIGFLLKHPRGQTIQAVEETLMLKFDNTIFDQLFKIPGFGQSLSRSLASRVQELSASSFLPRMIKVQNSRPRKSFKCSRWISLFDTVFCH